jgi:hypothetical protein
VIRFHGNRVEVLVSQSETLIFHFITLLNALVCRFKVELAIKLPTESRIYKNYIIKCQEGKHVSEKD